MEVDEESNKNIRHIAPLDDPAHACLKNEFTEDEKCHNFMRWLIYFADNALKDEIFFTQNQQSLNFHHQNFISICSKSFTLISSQVKKILFPFIRGLFVIAVIFGTSFNQICFYRKSFQALQILLSHIMRRPAFAI